MIRVEELCKSFGDTKVLDGISCSISKGEVVAVLGASGAGKSTFLRCLNYLEIPDSGRITMDDYTIDAQKCTKKDMKKIRDKSSMIFQNFSLFYNKTVLENITLPLRVVQKKSAAEANEIADEILMNIGLTDKKGSYPSELSGGQQQRVGIGRALAMKRKIMLFDEPTSALDPTLSKEVLDLIKRIAEKHETTMVIVTHEIPFAFSVADRILVINKGVIVENDTPTNILQNPQSEETRAMLDHYQQMLCL